MSTENIKKASLKGMFWKFAERFCAQGVTFFLSIILARLLMPEDYAVISLIMVFIMIANIILSDGLCAALIQKKDIDYRDYSTVLWGGLFFSIGMYGIVFLIAPFVAEFYNLPILSPTLRVLGLRIIIGAVNSLEIAYLSKRMEFKKFFWATLGGTVSSAIIGIFMALQGFGVWALIVQSLSNHIIDTIMLFLTIRKRPKLYFSYVRMKNLFSFGSRILFTNLLFVLVDQLRTLIIGRVYSKVDLGYYTKGKSFPELLSQNMNSPISSVAFPAMSSIQGSIDAVREYLRKGTQLISYCVPIFVLGLASVSRPLVTLLLTEKWLPCIPFIWIGAIYYMLPPIHSLNLEAVKAIGRGNQVLKYGFIKRGVSITTLLATVWISVEAIAWGLVVSAVIATFINAYQNKKLFNYSYVDQFKDIVPNVLIGVVMCIIVYFIGNILNTNMLLTLFIQIISGVFIVVVLSIIMRNRSFLYIFSMLKKIIKNTGIIKI